MSRRGIPISFSCLAVIGLAVVHPGCGGSGDGSDRKVLMPPTTQAMQGAIDFKSRFPQARVYFSQNSGEILWIDGGGRALERGTAVGSSADALAIVTSFMQGYPNLFRIDGPAQNLATDESSLIRSGASSGVVSLRFIQLQQGIPIRGKYGVALFSPSGDLLALQTRLLPTEQFHEAPGGSIASTSQPLSVGGGASGVHNPRVLPVVRFHAWDSPADGQPFRVIEEKVERQNIRVLRTVTDPATGAVISTSDETPSALVTAPSGWEGGAFARVGARSADGQTRTVPSTEPAQALVLGFRIDSIHASGAGVGISDANGGAWVPEAPIASDQPDWLSEPAYDANYRDATRLNENIEVTLRWFKESLGWSSWDGKGSPLFAAIRGHKQSSPDPEVNSWGANGMILIGNGHTSTGQPVSDALDVVAHEFTHSVIDATAGFEYHGEPGALNESLADIFGECAASFTSTIFGVEAGWYKRDLLHPDACTTPGGQSGDCAQPARYSDFINLPADDDHGGVHVNSGIVNRALSAVIKGDAAGGVPSGFGPAPVAALLMGSLRHVAYSSGSSLEEFAAALGAYCRVRERAGTLGADQSGICAALEASFTSTELLSAPK